MPINPLKCLRCDSWFADYKARGTHVWSVHQKPNGSFDPVLAVENTEVEDHSMPTDTKDEITRLERLASIAHTEIYKQEIIEARARNKITALRVQIENCYHRVDSLKENNGSTGS